MFYENQAGATVVSQEVNVNSRAGCGWKIVKTSGTIFFTRNRPTWRATKCVWYFQLPSTQIMEFQIKKITFNDDKATLSLYEGSLASKSINALYYFDTAHARGPFISLMLSMKAWSLGGFTLDYWPKSEGPPTTVATKSSTIKPITSKPSRKPTTIKPTKQKPVKAKQKGGKGGSSAGAIAGGIIGALVLVALILLAIYREKLLRKCGYVNVNMKTTETTSTPMFEVDTSKQAC